MKLIKGFLEKLSIYTEYFVILIIDINSNLVEFNSNKEKNIATFTDIEKIKEGLKSFLELRIE